MKLGIDAGNHSIKIMGEAGAFKCSSALGEHRERRFNEVFGTDDVEFEFRGRKGFAGRLAEVESLYAGSIAGTTKAHEDALLRVLIGISLYPTSALSYEIIVGQPISTHTPEAKKQIKTMLQGDHAIVINDERRNILIERVEVAAEGGVAYWSAPRKGLIRILDFGSGTVNGATLLDGKYVDRDSFTMAFGTETLDLSNAEAFVRAVFIKAQQKRWKRTDTILIVGWSAESMLQLVQKHYENAEVLRPRDPNREGLVYISPVFANAVGMYRVAQEVFK